VYPVGSIYLSTTKNTSPADIFGGTWQPIGGTFLLGADSTYTAGDTGGEAAHTLTKAELPAEKIDIHTEYSGTDYPVMLYNTNAASGSQWPLATYGANGVAQLKTEPLGSGTAHNNMPPYLVVYMWVRTA
jgi:microcystin-dependent protein